jgi:hypothetical protein
MHMSLSATWPFYPMGKRTVAAPSSSRDPSSPGLVAVTEQSRPPHQPVPSPAGIFHYNKPHARRTTLVPLDGCWREGATLAHHRRCNASAMAGWTPVMGWGLGGQRKGVTALLSISQGAVICLSVSSARHAEVRQLKVPSQRSASLGLLSKPSLTPPHGRSCRVS